ncbi:hypothetical protein [Pseudomonas aeruginosa]|uniref:hypothetical protein n=1 Tax=Pseudomonas aeruginosa TaxID=287 RepID=UPI002935AD68|nr:hypothetical protein [Pseudomonas aeruginosa]MDV2663551.1 hypothetical protein [Pseudomonas aeruginosa]
MEQAMREEFEAWVRTQVRGASLATVLVYSDGNDLYLNPHIQGRYEGWKASRAALRVELPRLMKQSNSETYTDGVRAGWNACRDELQENLQQAGIEVK